ncbi:MAG TPA: TIGR03960 family B12-binding radical SAM protein [Candidatus Hydrogenedentes bacterium]|nr:TIGR03960 family B12-binding radical SAM protein [Candidatus Hydrogenedentota bacterium]HPG67145.1 TIGR03960 family B12-binding radical SAM protein [Candidatus Hydrogenedentota bacterium]
MTLRDILEAEVLPAVRKPSRYLGCEFNAVHKDAEAMELRVALVFPDVYELGLGNLGLQILYAILNDLEWCWAERAYAPADDMEEALRARRLPLFLQESKDPLRAADLVGFTFQTELTYTNVLNVLDLAGIPLRSAERDEPCPLVFAGGPTVTNPEPMAPFIDFFAIGDGEEIIVEIAEAARRTRGLTRTRRLEAMAAIEGVYVPAAPAQRVPRRVVTDLDAARSPQGCIVPFTQLIHDRVGIEVFRGCLHGCRFCQAGMIGRPVRERGLEALDRLIVETQRRTGHEEFSLVSLSTCDYSDIRALVDIAARHAQRNDAAVSLPSLRMDTFSVDLADALAGVRRSGLTFAPEAATPRLRAVINKWITDEDVLGVCEEAFRRGWDHIKCYFMIGLPTETDEDVEAIADLCLRMVERGRAVNPRASVFTSVSTFVPKPFTPFQWAAQIDLDETRRRQEILFQRFRRHASIKYGRHDPQTSFIEGLLARGDRRAADLVEAAFKQGARRDTDSERLDFGAWRRAIEDTGFDVAHAFRARALDEPLPWDPIDVHVSKAWLESEWHRAQAGALTPDCRQGACNACGVRDQFAGLCQRLTALGPRDRAPAEAAVVERAEPPAEQRVRVRVGREGEVRFLSHLEWAAAWIRALRRADVPLAYTQGFHAHPKVAFATAPPVGEESEADYMDIVLRGRRAPDEMARRLAAVVPQGFLVFEASEVPLAAPSSMSLVDGHAYRITARADIEVIAARVADVLAAEALPVERKGRPTGRRKRESSKTVDIRPCIRRLDVASGPTPDTVTIHLEMAKVNDLMAKPREALDRLGLDAAEAVVRKTETRFAEGTFGSLL